MAKAQITIKQLRTSALARKIGISASYASELISGKKSPSLDIAVRIERAYGIAPHKWLEREAA